MFKGGNSVIYNNKIYNNYDGIILNQSFPDVKFNHIKNNQENGVMMMMISEPQMHFNEIKANKGLGLYIRDLSEPEIGGNHIISNQMDFASENESIIISNVKKNNSIGQHIYIKTSSKCLIF